METSEDYKTMMNMYTNTQKIIDTEKQSHVKEKRKAKLETAKLVRKLKETQDKLSTFWFDVYKPLMAQILQKDEEYDKLEGDFKLLDSITRLPKMCKEYQKALQNQTRVLAQKKSDSDAEDHIKKLMGGRDIQAFMGNFCTHLDMKYHLMTTDGTQSSPKSTPTHVQKQQFSNYMSEIASVGGSMSPRGANKIYNGSSSNFPSPWSPLSEFSPRQSISKKHASKKNIKVKKFGEIDATSYRNSLRTLRSINNKKPTVPERKSQLEMSSRWTQHQSQKKPNVETAAEITDKSIMNLDLNQVDSNTNDLVCSSRQERTHNFKSGNSDGFAGMVRSVVTQSQSNEHSQPTIPIITGNSFKMTPSTKQSTKKYTVSTQQSQPEGKHLHVADLLKEAGNRADGMKHSCMPTDLSKVLEKKYARL